MNTLYDPGDRVRVLCFLDGVDDSVPILGTVQEFVSYEDGDVYVVTLDPAHATCTEDDRIWEIEEHELDPWKDGP